MIIGFKVRQNYLLPCNDSAARTRVGGWGRRLVARRMRSLVIGRRARVDGGVGRPTSDRTLAADRSRPAAAQMLASTSGSASHSRNARGTSVSSPSVTA
jgi:hypothetical protein